MTGLAYFIEEISTARFVTIWFITPSKDLAHAKRDVEGAIQQLLHRDSCSQARDGPYEKAASNSMEMEQESGRLLRLLNQKRTNYQKEEQTA